MGRPYRERGRCPWGRAQGEGWRNSLSTDPSVMGGTEVKGEGWCGKEQQQVHSKERGDERGQNPVLTGLDGGLGLVRGEAEGVEWRAEARAPHPVPWATLGSHFLPPWALSGVSGLSGCSSSWSNPGVNTEG